MTWEAHIHINRTFTDLVIDKKIRPMALCLRWSMRGARYTEVEVRALEALGMGGDYPRA